jgi:hypothetical protein
MSKRFFVVGLIVAVLAGGAIGWLWWALRPGASPETALPLLPENPRDLAAPSPSEPEPVAPAESPDMPIGPIDRGTLVVEARGQRLGTETYTLERRQTGELSLHSEGRLNFKIAFFPVQATFVQAITFTPERRPISYQVELSGPLGIGNRKVSASFGTDEGIVDDGQHHTKISLPQEPFLLLGMFSSYAILPLWAKPDLSQKLKVISLRGDRRDQGEVWVLLQYVGSVQLRSTPDGSLIDAEEYLLVNERLTLKLYLAGERLLALQHDIQKRDESFRLYRSDLFSNDLKVLYK